MDAKLSQKPAHLKTGEKGENIAVTFLQNAGYLILERNYRFEKSEIDIIAQKDKFLIFVEVKTLTNTHFGMPEIAVTKQKAKNITNGALNYIYTKDWKKEIRFDIIAIVLHQNSHEIEHLIDAFH